MKPLLSILICTVPTRADQLAALKDRLEEQAQNKPVEIVSYLDNFEHSIGFKRNKLLDEAQGQYVCFVDDDDRVHDRYADLILEGITDAKPDCCSLVGVIDTPTGIPKRFIHSIKYDRYFEDNQAYYRPPNHLNAIRKDLLDGIRYPEKDHGEDYDFAMKLLKAGVLKTEYEITVPFYFYDFDPAKSESVKRRHR